MIDDFFWNTIESAVDTWPHLRETFPQTQDFSEPVQSPELPVIVSEKLLVDALSRFDAEVQFQPHLASLQPQLAGNLLASIRVVQWRGQ